MNIGHIKIIIVCAAVRYPDGKTLVGPRHLDYVMLKQYQALGIKEGEDKATCGFIDQEGNFYTRCEAWKIAEENNQIRYRTPGDTANGGTLFSENLY